MATCEEIFRDHLDGLEAAGPARVRGATALHGGAFPGGWEVALDQLPGGAEVVVELPVRSVSAGSGASRPEVVGPTGLALSPLTSAAATPGAAVGCGCSGSGGLPLAPLGLVALALAAFRVPRRRRGPPWCARRPSG